MKQTLGRAGALLGALLFLVTSAALTIFVIWQAAHQDNTTTPDTTTPQAQTCDITTPVPAQTLQSPAVYKPTGKVSTLQVTDLKPGTGQAAQNGDCLVMKYQGNLASNGSVFDENYSKPQALQFALGQHQVIQGWDEGLVGMKVGGERRLVIPSALAYGSQSPSSSIPANSNLVFIVQLLSIKPAK